LELDIATWNVPKDDDATESARFLVNFAVFAGKENFVVCGREARGEGLFASPILIVFR